MKRVIKSYFTEWWVPLLADLFPLSIFLVGVLLRRDWLVEASLVVFSLNVIGTLVSSVVQVVIRKWYFIFPQLLITAVLFYYVRLFFYKYLTPEGGVKALFLNRSN
jgi:hypothetical protein